MIADQLKRAVLQAAIQGKLTEQLPEDGDARDLLEEIKAEKERLIKEGKIKKEKPLPDITEDEIPFDIPENWCWVRLEEAVDLIMGQSPEGNTVGNKGVEFHQGKIAFGDKIIQNSNQFCSSPKKIAKPNSILLCVRAPVGKVNLTDREICIGRGLAALSPFSTNVYFLFYLLIVFEDYFIRQSTGTTFKAISKEIIRQTIIPLPPLVEQHRIVEKIEEIFPEIAHLGVDENKLDTLQQSFQGQMKSSILQAAIQGKLTEQLPEDGDALDLLEEIKAEKERLIKEGKIKKGKPLSEIAEDEIPFVIPDNWCWVRLGEITFNRGQKKPNKEFTYIDISSIDNKNNQLGDLSNILKPDNAPSRARKIVTLGDVIYATVRPYLHNICMIDRIINPEPIVSTGFAVVSSTNVIINKFLFWCFLTPMFDDYANDNENAKGVAYPAINNRKFLNAIIPLPPLAEQQRIVQRLDELLPLCDTLE